MRRAPTPVLAALLLLAAAPSSAREIDRPDLSGHWVLDLDRVTAAREPGSDLSRGGRRPGRGGDLGERPSGAGAGDPRALREQLAALERAAAELEIRREGAGFALRDGLGRDWPVTADGVEHAVVADDGSETFVRSEWDERGRLKIWSVRAGAPTIEQTLELADDGAALRVETRVDRGRRGERTVARLYTRAQGADTPAVDPEREANGAPNG